MDVMFYEVFTEEEEALKRFMPRQIQAGYTAHTIQAAGHESPPAPLVSVRTQSLIPVAWSGRLSGILSRSTGYDHLLRYRRQCGLEIPCGYLPLYCARSVAEHAILMIMALLKNLKKQQKNFRSFNRDRMTGCECQGKKILIAGVGNIGKEAALLARAIGMNVRGVDLVKKLDWLDYVSLEEGILFAEVILCALPLTPQTKGLLGYPVLRRARQGVLLVNIGRGEISPALDLKRLLEEGILGGVALDVFEDEGLFAELLRSGKGEATAGSKLYLELEGRDNVIFTPHNAFNTREALERKAAQSAQSVSQFLKDRIFPYPVPQEGSGEGSGEVDPA